MRKFRWLMLGFVITGSLNPSPLIGEDSFAPPGRVLRIDELPAANENQPVSYEATGVEQPVCDSFGLADAGCDSCCLGNWRDNTELYLGGDSYASLGDVPLGGYGNSFGLVTGFNTGFGLGDSLVRGQVGATYGAYDFSGRGFGAEAQSLEQQFYFTGGASKRSDVDAGDYVSWGLVYDAFFTDNWGANALELQLGQVRGLVGYALNYCNEVGVWGTLNAQTDNETVTTLGNVNLRAMNQANLFWRHNYDFGGSTMLYTGVMDNADVGDWVVGLNGRSPLNDNVALVANFNYVVPGVGAGITGDTLDQWNVSFGLVFFLGGKSVSPNVSGQQGLPLMPVANNGSFLVTD